MRLSEELYFEIELNGEKREIDKFVAFLRSGELDDFFEFDSDYIDYGDEYADAGDGENVGMTYSNDDIGIEITRFDVEEFLDVFCRAARMLDIRGKLFDSDDGEYDFSSAIGDSSFCKIGGDTRFNDDYDDEYDD